MSLTVAQQQEEQDRKAARLKDMEARRQALLQKKAEEEKLKADEEEKKTREDAERRKKEREENTGQRPLVRAESKVGIQASTRAYADPRFEIARRRGQCKEKKGDGRDTQSQAALEGEKGRTANPYHEARPDLKFEDNNRDEAAVYHVVEAVYERQSSANGEACYQIGSCFCLD